MNFFELVGYFSFGYLIGWLIGWSIGELLLGK